MAWFSAYFAISSPPAVPHEYESLVLHTVYAEMSWRIPVTCHSYSRMRSRSISQRLWSYSTGILNFRVAYIWRVVLYHPTKWNPTVVTNLPRVHFIKTEKYRIYLQSSDCTSMFHPKTTQVIPVALEYPHIGWTISICRMKRMPSYCIASVKLHYHPSILTVRMEYTNMAIPLSLFVVKFSLYNPGVTGSQSE